MMRQSMIISSFLDPKSKVASQGFGRMGAGYGCGSQV